MSDNSIQWFNGDYTNTHAAEVSLNMGIVQVFMSYLSTNLPLN